MLRISHYSASLCMLPYRDKNGRLTFADFCLLREHICQLSGWQEGSAKRRHTEDLFLHMWHDLQRLADSDHDDVITAQEWIPGDGVIDEEEFVYVLTDFGGSSETVTFEYFRQLAEEYYMSNDPAAVGNFLTGKLDFVSGEYANM
ncbi:uncharacterized protein LOC119109408 [Pollicipes pollicipes]|uniref:uncharacterized protein LOC119109408 n=1 Tax=Pollicipes pollicipes TaxID=41117 RepID=UPI001884997A|nr:uncharacterized protein LOC119109408 [Pollicipes pollicipes]